MDVDFVVQDFDRSVGLSRYSRSLLPELREHCDVSVRRPWIPELLRRPSGWIGDFETFFSSFPMSYERPTGDVLHVSGQTLALPLLYRDYGPTVVTVHDIFPYMFAKDSQFDPIEPWYERGMYRFAMRALKKADHIIAISDATKRSLQEYLDISEKKISRIYYGVDQDLFKPMVVPDELYERYGLNPADRHVLYVGSERPRKAVWELVTAFAEVLRDVPSARLVKVGKPEVPSVRERIKEALWRMGISDRVVFTGHVEDDLPLLYNMADVFASASYYEGFGLPFVEAMACGTPVVARNRSAMLEVVGNGGAFFESIEELVGLLRRILSERKFRKTKVENAKQRSEPFSWGKSAVDTASIYESASNG